jgi:hypothetical protein
MSLTIPTRRALLRSTVVAAAPTTIGTPTSLGSISNANASTTRQLTSKTIPAGALAIAFMADDGSDTFPFSGTVADTASNSYVGGTEFDDNSGGITMRLFKVENATALSSGDITGTFATADATLKSLHAAYVTGILTSSSADKEVAAKGVSTAPSVATGALSQANEVIFAALSALGGGDVVFTEDTGNGWTTLSLTQTTDLVSLSYKVVSSATSVTYAPTLSASRHWGVQVWSFKGA